MSDQTPEEKQAETNELGRALTFFGDVAKTGFWGALFAGVLAIGARMFMGSGTGQEMMEGSYEAQLMANKLGGFLSWFGFEEMYDEAALEQTFLTDKTLTTLVSSQLADTNIVIGDETLAKLLDTSGNNRAITLALLKSEGFSVENPTSLSMESLQKALIKAIKGEKIVDAAGKPITIGGKAVDYTEELDTYSGIILTAMIKDIKDNPKTEVGTIRYVRDLITSFTAENNAPGNAPMGKDADLIGAFLKTHTSQAIELLGLVSEDETVKTFVGNTKNQAALKNLVATLPQEDVTALSKLLFEKMATPANEDDKASALTTLLTSPEFTALKGKNPEVFAKFVKEVDRSSLPEDVQGMMNLHDKINSASISDIGATLSGMGASVGSLFGFGNDETPPASPTATPAAPINQQRAVAVGD